jgi:Imidazoleglycerol-phosphate synthase
LEMLSDVASVVSIPIVASGGAGKMEDFVSLFSLSGVDAGLAASIFHSKQVLIDDLKKYLVHNGVHMRI